MDSETERKITENLFVGSRAAVEPWGKFPWHLDRQNRCDTWKPNSSQALAIDVFGFLKEAPQVERDAVLDGLAKHIGIPAGGPWHIELEWTDDTNQMCEMPNRKSQIDALAHGLNSLVFFECKFGERDGGPCSGPQPLRTGEHKGIKQCNGLYRQQVNPVDNSESKCALSGKGIRYWEVIPAVFYLDSAADYESCPFAGPAYQWMRNLTLCHETARAEKLIPAFVIVYAEDSRLPFASKLTTADWSAFTKTVRSDAIVFGNISYQTFLEDAKAAVLAAGGDVAKWDGLCEWVNNKIKTVASQVRTRRKSN